MNEFLPDPQLQGVLAVTTDDYKDCGWDMIRSVNTYGEELYPSFGLYQKMTLTAKI